MSDQAMTREEKDWTCGACGGRGGHDEGCRGELPLIEENAALREELRLWRDAHVGGCPTIADDESDQVLADCGICTCVPLLTQLSTLREELAGLHRESQEVQACLTDDECPTWDDPCSVQVEDAMALRKDRDRLREELAQVKKQPPVEMQSCTILFKECPERHGGTHSNKLGAT